MQDNQVEVVAATKAVSSAQRIDNQLVIPPALSDDDMRSMMQPYDDIKVGQLIFGKCEPCKQASYNITHDDTERCDMTDGFCVPHRQEMMVVMGTSALWQVLSIRNVTGIFRGFAEMEAAMGFWKRMAHISSIWCCNYDGGISYRMAPRLNETVSSQ